MFKTKEILQLSLIPSHKFNTDSLYIGVDEAGRGCLAGPVVASAVLFPVGFDYKKKLPNLNDSKKLSQKQREVLAPLILSNAIAYGIGLSWAVEIDSINIVNATFRAMSRAVINLWNRQSMPLPEHKETIPLVIDGNLLIRKEQWFTCASVKRSSWHIGKFPLHNEYTETIQNSDFISLPKQSAIVGGDSLVPSISAASILAKTRRDAIMCKLDQIFSGYSFSKHKGYGTKAHKEALLKLGACPLHRKTFLKNFIKKESKGSLTEELYIKKE